MTRPNNRGREHFGFLDGISQPGIRDGQLPEAGPLWPGEFVFGYASHDAKDPAYPGKLASGGPEWTRNGSLMVIRRLHQRVPEFNRFIETADNHMDRDLLAARIVGRWKSGAPLSIAALQDDPLLGADDGHNNDFDFANDPQGRRCPLASHIRKAYPRTDITDIPAARAAVSNIEKREVSANDTYTHRVIRRGIPFGPELSTEEKASGHTTEGVERGLMFVCYQTSIVRQFEYIVRNFTNNDALLGQDRDRNTLRHFEGLTLPYPSGDPGKSITLDTFVYPTGGGYFFMPSLSAFEKFVATPGRARNEGGEYGNL